MNSRPNILLITTDQQSADAMSCAGNVDIRTPSLDSLAERGTRFTECYCSFPLCTPARASLYTGQMPHELGIMGNGGAIPECVAPNELGRLMNGSGYECAYAGKWHIPEIALPEKSHGYKTIAGFDDNAVARACSEFVTSHSANNTARNVRERKPFFLVASFDNPHNICEWAREQPLPWSPNIIVPEPTMCPWLPRNFEISGEEPEPIRRVVDFEPKVYGTPALTDDGWWRQLRFAYYRLVEHVDGQIGAILAALDTSGLSNDTLVVFTSDHGDANGAHRLKQKTFLYEEQTKVPLIVAPPGPGRSSNADGTFGNTTGSGTIGRVDEDHLVAGGLDVYATILDYARIEIPRDSGMSVRPIVEAAEVGAPHISHREAVFSETEAAHGSTVSVEGRMVRTGGFKYNAYSWGRFREQLFDLCEDPGEMTNLAYRETYQQIRDEHRALLLKWCRETNDAFGSTYGHPGIPTVPGYEYGL